MYSLNILKLTYLMAKFPDCTNTLVFNQSKIQIVMNLFKKKNTIINLFFSWKHTVVDSKGTTLVQRVSIDTPFAEKLLYLAFNLLVYLLFYVLILLSRSTNTRKKKKKNLPTIALHPFPQNPYSPSPQRKNQKFKSWPFCLYILLSYPLWMQLWSKLKIKIML